MIGDALAGVRVVALEQAVAMPFCTFMLASLGADVIKVESRGGDVVRGWDDVVGGLASGFVAFNAGKRDISLDAKSAEGREALWQLALSADVFVENFAPGAANRLGVGAADLRAEKPSLVYCSLSGYGQDGPYRDVKAYDLLIQGESGLLLANGTPDAPAKIGIPVTDQIAGAHAALGIVAALHRRSVTGEGAHIDVAMLESAAFWLAYYPHHWWHRQEEPPRSGMRHQYICPYGPFRASDGRYVNIVVANDADWQRFCTAVEREEWMAESRFETVSRRQEARLELDRLVEQVIATAPSDAWEARLAAVRLPYGSVRPIGEMVDHPQLIARQVLTEVDSPVGKIPFLRFPLGAVNVGPVPAHGGDTDAVLREIGYGPEQIAEFRRAGSSEPASDRL